MPVAPYQIHRQRQKLDLSRCRSFDNNLCDQSSRNQSPVISHNQSYNHRQLPIPFTPIPMATPPENMTGSPTGILKSSPSYRENSFASKLEDFSDNESNYSNLSNSNLKQPNNVHKVSTSSKSTFHFPFKSERSKTVTEGYNLSNNSPSFNNNNDCSSSTSSAQNSSTTSNSNHKRQNSFLQKKISKLIQTTRSSVSDWKRKQTLRHEPAQRYESPGRGSKERREHDSRYKSADILLEEDEFPTTTRGVSSSRVKSSSFDNILSSINSKYFTIPRKSKNIDINEALVVKIMHEQQKTKEEAEQLIKLQRLESLEIDRPVFTYSIYKLNSIGRRQSKKQTLHLDLDQEIFFIIGRGCVEIEICLSEIESIERSTFNHSSSDHCFSIETSNNNLPLILEAESAETRGEIICRVKSFMTQKFGTEETFSGILEKKSKSLNIWSKKEVRIEGSKLYYRSLISQKQYYKRTIDITTGKAVITPNNVNCQIRINDGYSTYIFREPNLNSVVFNNWVSKISAAQSSTLHDSGRYKERELQPEGLFERIFGEIYAIQKDSKSSSYHLSRMEDYLKQLQQNMSEQRRGSNVSSKSGSVVLLTSNHLQLQQSPSYGSSLGAASSHKEESSIDNSPFINSDNNSLHKSSQDTSVISSSGNEKQDSTKSENEANNRNSNIYLELESVTYCPEDTCETYLKPVEKLILETESNLGRKSDASGTFPSPPEPYQNTENPNISQTSNITPETLDTKRYSGSFDNDPCSEYTTLEAEKDCLAESLEDHRIDYQKQVSEPEEIKPDSDSRPQSVYDNLTTEPSDEEAKSQPRSDYENMSESESQSKKVRSEVTSQAVQGDALERQDYVIESDKHYDSHTVNVVGDEPNENHYVILEDTDDDKGNESPYCNDEPQPEPKIRHASEKSSDNLTIENSSEQRSTPETLEAFTSESETSGPTNQNSAVSQKPDNFGQELPPPKSQGNRLSSSPCNFPSPPSPLRVEQKPQTPVITKQPPTPVFQEPSTPGIPQSSASGPQIHSPVVIAGPPKPPPPPPIPPPMFGSAPPPPPPPGPGKLTTRKSILGSKKGPNLKPIHWKGISGHDRLESSLWKSSIASQNVKINEEQLKKLEAMFKVESSANKKRAVRSLGQKAVYNLDQNRARNLELFLKRKEFDLDEHLLNMYFSLTDVESQTHFLQQIRDFQPSDADLKHFSNLADAELADLPAVHKNMAVICRIPNFNLKLDILHSVTEIRDQCLQVENNIQAALDMCKRLQNCENLHLLLQFCLSVGNHLNEGARKPKIEAFSIMDSLPRFLDVKSSTSDYTLLNYIVELIVSQNLEILNVTDEIDMRQVDFLIGDLSPKPPKSGKRDGFYMLKAPVDFLSKSSAKAQESVVKIKEMQFAAKLDLPNENCPEKYFVEQVQKLLQLDCVFQIIKCKDLLNELEKSYHNLLTLLAEDKSTDPAQLFSILNNFISSISQIKSQMKADSSPKMPSHKNSATSYKDAAFLSELTEATKKLK